MFKIYILKVKHMDTSHTSAPLTYNGDTNLFIHQLMEQMELYSELENCSVTWEFFNNELEFE
mgnify:CR=1 FL=1